MKPAGRDDSGMTATTSRTDWLLFILLGFLWGSSFLFIKIGVEAGLPPFTLVMLRLLIGFGLLAVVVAAARERLPREERVYGHLFVMGAINIALPFTLITWAEMHVDSTLTSVLNAAVPIFVIPIGAIFLRDEPLTVGRVVGVLLGFVGVALLVGFDPAAAAGVDLLGALAVIAATISYAAGAVYARRNVRGLRPMIPALFQVGFGLLITSVLAFVLERPFELTLEPQAFLAVVWLGLLGFGRGLPRLLRAARPARCRRHGRRCVPAAGVRCHPRRARAARTARWAPARRAGADRRGHRARQQPDRARTVSARTGSPPPPLESPPMRTDLRAEDVADLLEQPLIAVLATRRKDDTVMLSPVWFEWRDGGINMWVPTPEGGKVAHVQRDPRVTVVVANSEWPYKGFEIRGEATVSGDDFYDVLRRTALRYDGPEAAERMVSSYAPGVVIRVEPGVIRAWDYEDEA